LRGLTLDGAGTASTGISSGSTSSGASNNGTITITDCFIRHFTTGGINLSGSASILKFLISNTVSSDNTGGYGLSVSVALGKYDGVVDHFTASGDKIGIDVPCAHSGTCDVTIVDSVMAENVSEGLQAGPNPEGPSAATVRLAASVVKGNGVGVNVAAASAVFSYGDNEINGNGTDIVTVVSSGFGTLAKK
jgi:hypothetical protein